VRSSAAIAQRSATCPPRGSENRKWTTSDTVTAMALCGGIGTTLEKVSVTETADERCARTPGLVNRVCAMRIFVRSPCDDGTVGRVASRTLSEILEGGNGWSASESVLTSFNPFNGDWT
jgi:hypothetical protein